MSFKFAAIAFALLCPIPSATIGQPASKPSQGKQGDPPVSLADSAWEVKYPDSPKLSPRLYRFEADGKFGFSALEGVFMYGKSARWKARDNRFEVWVPKGDWTAEGTFTKDTIRGKIGQGVVFQGRRIGPETYDFPVEEGEVVLTVKLRKYALGGMPDAEHFEEYLKQSDGTDLKKLDKWQIGGLIFEITSPKEYRGKFITSHHDGMLASGDVTEIAKPGKEYKLRIGKWAIDDKNFKPCSIDLLIRPVPDKQSFGGYRSGTSFLAK
jgi:hypothetical protein